MPSPKAELLEDMRAACCRARDSGMRYDAILAEIRTLEAQVRMAQRAHALDHEQRRAAQPGPGGRFRVGYRPMAALVDSVMPGART